MSKTTNYQLTLWDYADEDFSPGRARGDLAANFTKLDTALKAEESARKSAVTAETNARKSAVNTLNTALAGKAVIVVGSYTGNGANIEITLGFRPKLVIVCMNSTLGSVSYLAIDGIQVNGNPITLATKGFTVWSSSGASGDPNAKDITYQYFVLR